jgi:hypothetical protein
MELIKVKYNGVEYDRLWELNQKIFPNNIAELCIFLILSNQFFDINYFIKSRKEMLLHNQQSLSKNLEYLKTNKISSMTLMGKKVTIKQYEKHVLQDIENIKEQIAFSEDNKHEIKLTLAC